MSKSDSTLPPIPDRIHVRHILVRHEFEAQDLERKLREGATFEELAQKFSTCPSNSMGGDLGPQKPGRFVESFADAAIALSPGEISAPVRTQFGYHLIQRIR